MIENTSGKHYVLCPEMILWQNENSFSKQLSSSYFQLYSNKVKSHLAIWFTLVWTKVHYTFVPSAKNSHALGSSLAAYALPLTTFISKGDAAHLLEERHIDGDGSWWKAFLVNMKNPSQKGDQYAVVQIQVPRNVSQQAKNKLKEFEALCGQRGNASY